jgi:hypothetical protein
MSTGVTSASACRGGPPLLINPKNVSMSLSLSSARPRCVRNYQTSTPTATPGAQRWSASSLLSTGVTSASACRGGSGSPGGRPTHPRPPALCFENVVRHDPPVSHATGDILTASRRFRGIAGFWRYCGKHRDRRPGLSPSRMTHLEPKRRRMVHCALVLCARSEPLSTSARV